jgi:hypothetical protein
MKLTEFSYLLLNTIPVAMTGENMDLLLWIKSLPSSNFARFKKMSYPNDEEELDTETEIPESWYPPKKKRWFWDEPEEGDEEDWEEG